jgi:conjugal transfer/entry exclusion protein
MDFFNAATLEYSHHAGHLFSSQSGQLMALEVGHQLASQAGQRFSDPDTLM